MKYSITLNLEFHLTTYDEYEYIYNDDSDDDDPDPTERRKACWKFEEYLANKGGIENHVKENDPMEFVENLILDGEILSAEWHPDEFKLTMVVESDKSAAHLRSQLYENSLEDEQYECIDDNGWTVKTLGPNTMIYEYGLTEYRDSVIDIEPYIDETTPVEVTEKGLSLYKQMKDLKEKGITFSHESELKFQILELLAAAGSEKNESYEV